MPIPVISGFQFPFFPPRPITGVALSRRNVTGFLVEARKRYLVQKKLNGDRVILLVMDGKVQAANRHGSLYSFSISNANNFLKLPDKTILDGEVEKRVFTPFECVAYDGSSIAHKCPSVRAQVARAICDDLGFENLFDDPTEEWLEKLQSNNPRWEGVVKKALGTPYVPLASASQTSSTWVKNKW